MRQNAIRASVTSYGLDLKKLVGFGSDGCSTMLGKKGGVALKLQQWSPCLLAFHCPAHRLQLAILDIAGKVQTFRCVELILG